MTGPPLSSSKRLCLHWPHLMKELLPALCQRPQYGWRTTRTYSSRSAKATVSKRRPSKPTASPPLLSEDFSQQEQQFRTEFNHTQKIYWYPTHQSRALRQLQNGIHQIDVVVEVRDARIPLTSKNPKFDEILGRRPRLIVYNKADLANPNMTKPIVDAFRRHGRDQVVFTQADKGLHVKRILEWALEKYRQSPDRYPFLSMVVVGLPNVGKSSLINALRRVGVKKGKVSAVGPQAGVTQTIQTRVKIYDNPPIYLVDTPGIFDPHFTHPIEGLKIALTGATKDRLTEEENVADYLLFRLNNSTHREKYPAILGLPGPSDDIAKVLSHIARRNKFNLSGASNRGSHPDAGHVDLQGFALAFDEEELAEFGPKKNGTDLDIQRAAKYMIGLFRDGAFGPMTLDDCTPTTLDDWLKGSSAESGVEAQLEGSGSR
ncbi:uncharacterized protein SPPG_00399 [Spizellomyces punctatus DAOM BR117]|uniref:CP-type G domain-containing protein n=1 Tax=Spizellomyces punctatus (strain DAOM BR117) TaxID=645134 RepID=A0A0L0HTM0_SPIPD|nr:uncharacterized protein SPPG_00399 [Spizellomyces punctatus DAOM BR117]KND04686.1 hypothetical protein SPPG_00399 [Spizellomyces punctatus DAOM BR117]|eukprot:XP_016612725.1 hypothetical protein SPPG_00399 [Spizellomyces punctatus DAOM BR117]